MTVLAPHMEAYAKAFEALGAGDARARAFTRFAALDFPTTRHEDWRYSDLKGLRQAAYLPATASPAIPDAPEGVTIAKATAPVDEDSDSLALMNAAFQTSGYAVDVAAGVAVDAPLMIPGPAPAADEAAHPYLAITLGDGASLTLVEDFGPDAAGFTNQVTKITLGDGARLTHIRRQREASDAMHLAQSDVSIAAGANYHAFTLSTGGALARNEQRVSLVGAGAHVALDGAHLGAGRQGLDTRTLVQHLVPGCTSNQTFRQVLGGRATASFQGKVLVARDAQQTDAMQSVRSLILDRTATANAKPELEIYADDVKCAHGATVGEIDPDQLFYLMARGLDMARARALLVQGFIADLIEIVEDDTLRALLADDAARWMTAALMGHAK